MFNGCIIYVYVKLTYSHPAVSPLIYRGALGPRKHPVHLHCVYPVNSLSGRRSRGLPANVLHNQNVVPRRPDRPPRDVLVWVKLANGQIEHIDTITGPLTELVHAVDSFGHSNVQALTPRRLTMMEWATVGGVAGLTPRRYIVDDRWDTWTPSDPAEYAWHGHVLFFEDPVQHVPDGPMFVPTGLLPGQSEDHPDLAYYLNVWATCPSPLSGYKSAHSAVFSGVFLDVDDLSSLPSSAAFDVAVQRPPGHSPLQMQSEQPTLCPAAQAIRPSILT